MIASGFVMPEEPATVTEVAIALFKILPILREATGSRNFL
jgi:hypothetical protein